MSADLFLLRVSGVGLSSPRRIVHAPGLPSLLWRGVTLSRRNLSFAVADVDAARVLACVALRDSMCGKHCPSGVPERSDVFEVSGDVRLL